MENSNYRILTCDGGGIRGLMTAMLLQKLDAELGLLSKVDLFAGTSTGGIIALGLASGIPISKLVSLYSSDNNCSQVFKPYTPPMESLQSIEFSESPEPFLSNLGENECLEDNSSELLLTSIDLNKLPAISNINDPQSFLRYLLYVKYDNARLKTLLQQYLPNGTLADLKSKVLVTTFRLYNESNSNNPSWYPLTLDNLPQSESQNTRPVDAALCTASAPLYFPPYKHPSYGYCIDGGVFANNPSTLALARVLESGICIHDVRMLSIGTGSTQNYLPLIDDFDASKCGALRWFLPGKAGNPPKFTLLSIIFESSSIIDDLQCKMMLGKNKYRRVNLQLQEKLEMDDCSKIPLMQELVDEYIKSPEWRNIKAWIEKNFI